MLHVIWLGMLLAGIISILLSIILGVLFHIYDLAEELSGRRAKRQIKRLRELNIGTSSLDKMGTDEVYSVMPSGNLLSEDIVPIQDNSKDEFKKVYYDYEEGTEENEEATAEMGMPQETSVLRESDGTVFMDEDSKTDVLEGVRQYFSTKKNIIIIEEQSSLEGGNNER